MARLGVTASQYPSSLTRLALVLFFSSGACALIYQTVWVRQLTLSFGISIYAVSAVLSAFMFGLCIGATWIGRIADGIRNPLRAYGYCELAIAAYAGVLYFGLADLLPALLKLGRLWLPSGSAMTNVTRFLIAFGLLLVQTSRDRRTKLTEGLERHVRWFQSTSFRSKPAGPDRRTP
jgi:hypothetical protein